MPILAAVNPYVPEDSARMMLRAIAGNTIHEDALQLKYADLDELPSRGG